MLSKDNLCKEYTETKQCKDGDYCPNAHDIRELKVYYYYKTKKCIHFQKYGYCKYGMLCKRSH